MSFISLGQSIKAARKSKQLTQRELAQMLGISYTYISKIESGKIDGVSDTLLAQIAKTLNLDWAELLNLKLGEKLPFPTDTLETDRYRRLKIDNECLLLEIDDLKTQVEQLKAENHRLRRGMAQIKIIAENP